MEETGMLLEPSARTFHLVFLGRCNNPAYSFINHRVHRLRYYREICASGVTTLHGSTQEAEIYFSLRRAARPCYHMHTWVFGTLGTSEPMRKSNKSLMWDFFALRSGTGNMRSRQATLVEPIRQLCEYSLFRFRMFLPAWDISMNI